MSKLAQIQMIMIGWTLVKIAFVTYFATLNPWYVIPAYILVEFATTTIIPIPTKKTKNNFSGTEKSQDSTHKKSSVNRDIDRRKPSHENPASTHSMKSTETSVATEPQKKKSGNKRSMSGKKPSGNKRPYRQKVTKTN